MQNKKLNIAILMGGQSAEREVSLRTGKKIAQSLDTKKYNVNLIEISATGKWLFQKNIQKIKAQYSAGEDPKLITEKQQTTAIHQKNAQSLSAEWQKQAQKIDLVFIALHGPKGEDGTVQGMLELMGLAYTGSEILASALGMDKEKSRELFQFFGLNVPKCRVINTEDKISQAKQSSFLNKKNLSGLVVKPNSLGSSVGVFIVKSQNELKKAIQEVAKYDKKILIEEYLQGTEISCGVLENFKNKKYFALPPIEIVPKKKFKFFDYAAKYTPGATDEICPARLSPAIMKKAQEIAIITHKALNCRHYSRTDMIIKNKKIYVLEINTLPGMTETSLLPKEAKAVGLEFNDLIEHIIGLAKIKN